MSWKFILAAVYAYLFVYTMPAGAASCLDGGCHTALTSKKYIHGPVAAEQAGVKGCAACHVPAGKKCSRSGAGSFKPMAPPDRMCQTCHSRGTGSQHSAKKINCLKCHNPHGSDAGPELTR
jgi:hypothetical protein